MEYIPFGSQDKIKLTIAIVQNLICVKTKSGKVCSANDAIKFMMLCQARKLNPFEGDAYLIGYDNRDKPDQPTFSLITAHQAFLKRAEVNPEYDGMKSGIIIEDDDGLKDQEGDFYSEGQKVVGGWATVYFKNRKQPMHKRIRLSRFQKSFGIWQDDSAGMICKCAEADALRSSFPTMLGGLYIREETPAEQVPVASAPIFTATDTKVEQEEKVVRVILGTPPPEPVKSANKPKPEPSADYTKVKPILDTLAASDVTESEVIKFLKEMGTIDSKTKTLEDIASKEPEAFSLLVEQVQDIINRIKEVK